MKIRLDIEQLKDTVTGYEDLLDNLGNNEIYMRDQLACMNEYWHGQVSENYQDYFADSFADGSYHQSVELIRETHDLFEGLIGQGTGLTA